MRTALCCCLSLLFAAGCFEKRPDKAKQASDEPNAAASPTHLEVRVTAEHITVTPKTTDSVLQVRCTYEGRDCGQDERSSPKARLWIDPMEKAHGKRESLQIMVLQKAIRQARSGLLAAAEALPAGAQSAAREAASTANLTMPPNAPFRLFGEVVYTATLGGVRYVNLRIDETGAPAIPFTLPMRGEATEPLPEVTIIISGERAQVFLNAQDFDELEPIVVQYARGEPDLEGIRKAVLKASQQSEGPLRCNLAGEFPTSVGDAFRVASALRCATAGDTAADCKPLVTDWVPTLVD